MVQRREHFCLALKSREAVRVARERVGKDLERHLPLQAVVPGAQHL
jgi:hypothetical protein